MLTVNSALQAHGLTALEELGNGGSSIVYLAHWSQYPGETFVVKVIENKPNHVNTFENETSCLMYINHPNIIYMFKHFSVAKYEYIIFEHCSLGSLHGYITNNGPLEFKQFVILAKQILDAVLMCHKKGYVHLDIKPENILMKTELQLKLCDFGLAMKVEKEEKINLRAGSHLYLSPERLQPGSYDPFKADIWAIGVTLFFMASGTLPYSANSLNYMAQSRIDQPILYPLDMDPQIEDLISLCLRIKPEERPSIEELLLNNIFELPDCKLRINRTNSFFGITNSRNVPCLVQPGQMKSTKQSSLKITQHKSLFKRVSLNIYNSRAIRRVSCETPPLPSYP